MNCFVMFNIECIWLIALLLYFCMQQAQQVIILFLAHLANLLTKLYILLAIISPFFLNCPKISQHLLG